MIVGMTMEEEARINRRGTRSPRRGSSLRPKPMVKSKEVYMDKALQAKMVMADKKNAINQASWEAIREDDNRKAAMEDRRLTLEERKAMMELVADENRTMMMDLSTMDAFT
jgi:hypothetical protein